MVKAVFLDIDNTLLDFDACAEQAMAVTCRHYGIPFDERFLDMFHRINPVLWRQIELGELTKDALFAVRWKLIFAALGIETDAVGFRYMFQAGLEKAAVPVEGAMDLVQYLHGKYTVCIASNSFYDQQVQRLKLAGMFPYVDHMFISQRLGADKPAKAFFDGCFTQLPGIAPGETMMVGDSLSADIAGACSYGMNTIWYDHFKTGKTSDATYTVTSLDQIRNIL